MNRFHVMLLCLLVMTGVLIFAFVRTESVGGHGVNHPRYQAMKQGGSPNRHDPLLFAGWCYGVAQLVLFGSCLTLGLKRRPDVQATGGRWLAIATVAYVATFTMVLLSYGRSSDAASLSPFWGIPWATCWSVFGMWGVPLLYVAMYVGKFRTWIFTDEDEMRFAELKARYAKEQSDG